MLNRFFNNMASNAKRFEINDCGLDLDSKSRFHCELFSIVLSFQCSVMVIEKQEPKQCIFCTKTFIWNLYSDKV